MIKIKDEIYHCPLDVTMSIIGKKWVTLIMWYLKDGVLRNGELLRLIPQITQKMLTQRLKELEHADIVNRKMYSQIPPKVEYSLTPRGLELLKVFDCLASWGEAYANSYGEIVENK
jgi:DNA-binding HxlR family transcriptional regulator